MHTEYMTEDARKREHSTEPATHESTASEAGQDPVTLADSDWVDDVLGEGFQQRTLPLGSDDEGPLVATLVRRLPKHRTWLHRAWSEPRLLEHVDVLYVHGWSDYFFQTRLANFYTDLGARFFALDLRKYGRSLRKNQTPGYITNLEDYDEEIEIALKVMADSARGPRKLILFGHSTGGLILSLWAHRNPGRAHALVLNSPWLALQVESAAFRAALTTVVQLQSVINPLHTAPPLDYGYYAKAQAVCADPEDHYEIDERWRPARSQPVHAAWLRAIFEGHKQVSEGLSISCPVQVLLSQHSMTPVRWSDELTRTDTVLDVESVVLAATKLAESITIDRIDGALHDVLLSRREARNEAYLRLERWVRAWATIM